MIAALAIAQDFKHPSGVKFTFRQDAGQQQLSLRQGQMRGLVPKSDPQAHKEEVSQNT
jgi:hypothetical protein